MWFLVDSEINKINTRDVLHETGYHSFSRVLPTCFYDHFTTPGCSRVADELSHDLYMLTHVVFVISFEVLHYRTCVLVYIILWIWEHYIICDGLKLIFYVSI